ncbi:hypothetical protein QBC38DRAFT_530957 [Podospora fimiseda]|uniref:PARP catalytic domain-containing protein n=1 Tax=Podospora fimiseda TaxID=252190 RepID=A0AAN7BLA8_9PEZI|nr:hypothetical protein QBC38DRAFT_530957 [Podospora fimiseda]
MALDSTAQQSNATLPLGINIPHYQSLRTKPTPTTETHLRNPISNRQYCVLIICLVVLGKSQRLFTVDYNRVSPDPGYDSAEAAVRSQGGAVNYPETIVYDERQIIPTPRAISPSVDPDYDYYKYLFTSTWKPHGYYSPTPKIYQINIKRIEELNDSKRGRLWLDHTAKLHSTHHGIRFHGTKIKCNALIASINHWTTNPFKPCSDSSCSFCHIFRTSFKIGTVRQQRFSSYMYGRGIYSSSSSSKADMYFQDVNGKNNCYAALIICLVALGKIKNLFRPDNGRTAPDYGYDSVEGGSVNAPETVVYDERQIIPVGFIIYKR